MVTFSRFSLVFCQSKSLTLRQAAMALMVLMLGFSLSGCVGAVAGVGAAAVAAGSTEKGLGTSISDGVIKSKISDKFIKTNISLFTNISISVNDGTVIMTGTVEKPEYEIQATQLAWDTRGVISVISEIEVTDKSSLKSLGKDAYAQAQLRAKLWGDNSISSLNFSVYVVNGVIYLTGIASSEEEMTKVVNHARKVKFSHDVVNYIRIGDDDRS